MATFQTMVSIPELSEVTLQSWYKFLTTLGSNDTGALIGPTSAAIVASWSTFSESGREIAYRALEGIVGTMRNRIQHHSADIVDLSVIPELEPLARQLKELRGTQTPQEELQRILDQSSSDNLTVAMQSLGELKSFMLKQHKDYIREVTSGDMFDHTVSRRAPRAQTILCYPGARQLRIYSCQPDSNRSIAPGLSLFCCVRHWYHVRQIRNNSIPKSKERGRKDILTEKCKPLRKRLIVQLNLPLRSTIMVR